MKNKIKAQYRPKLIYEVVEMLDKNPRLKEFNIYELNWAVNLFLHCKLEEMDDGMEYHDKTTAAENVIYERFDQLSDEERENDNIARFYVGDDTAEDFEVEAEYNIQKPGQGNNKKL